MTISEQALTQTAEQLELTVAQVQQALAVQTQYHKIYSRLQAQAKATGKQAVQARELAGWEQRAPNTCFCEEHGLAPHHDVWTDEIMRTVVLHTMTTITGEVIPCEPYEQYYYRCQLCGKEWQIVVCS